MEGTRDKLQAWSEFLVLVVDATRQQVSRLALCVASRYFSSNTDSGSQSSVHVHTHTLTHHSLYHWCLSWLSLAPHLLQIRLSLPVLSCIQHSHSTACYHLPLWALRNLTSCLPHRLALCRTGHPPPLLALVQNCTLSDKIWIPLGKGHFVFYGKCYSIGTL